jgi:hypothetical protein
MASKSIGSTALALIPELPGRIPEVPGKEYRNFSDKALDAEIVESFGAAQKYYSGLRREVVLRLLPALAEMRQRHAAQGSRNDLNVRLGLPRKAGWEDYLLSRGLKPDTVRNWFQKHAASKVLGLLGTDNSPRAAVAEQLNANEIATSLIRAIESSLAKEKLNAVIASHARLNPTILKKLLLAVKNAKDDAASFEKQLSEVYRPFPKNGTAFQHVIRERMAELQDPDLDEKRKLAVNFDHAVVREISLAEARAPVMEQEWLGTLGSSEYAFGIFWGRFLGGCVCYGSTAGSHTKSSVCGPEHARRVTTLVRGCCLPWTPTNSASYLITEACKRMTLRGYNIFVGYADPMAGERGVIYQSCGWLHCGYTNPAEKFRTPSGKIYDARNVHLLTRDRSGGVLRFKRSRAEQKVLLIEEGCEFFKDSVKKGRFVGIYGDRRVKRVLRAALRWPVLEYPQRPVSGEPS